MCLVQVFGTEERVTDQSKIIPASTAVIPFVTFPGQEIKDLYVHETNTPPPAQGTNTTTSAPPAPPAHSNNNNTRHNNNNQRVSGGGQNQSNNQSNNNSKQSSHRVVVDTSKSNNNNSSSNNNNNHRRDENKSANPQSSTSRDHNNNNKRESNNNNATTTNHHTPKSATEQVGTGNHLLKMRERKNAPIGSGLNQVNNTDGSSTTAAAVATKSEFDFETGLRTFNKEEVLAEVATDQEGKVNKYVKDAFFDNLGEITVDGRKARLTAAEERQLNTDTFGAIALQGHRRGGRGGRGRGRGGRGGGGRGGGGGGYGRGRGNNNRGLVKVDA
jgi:hypothetical protein